MNSEVKDLIDEAIDLLTKSVSDAAVATDSPSTAALVELGARRLADKRVLTILESVTDEVYCLPEGLADAFVAAKVTFDRLGGYDALIPDPPGHAQKLSGNVGVALLCLAQAATALADHVLTVDHEEWREPSGAEKSVARKAVDA